MIKKMILNKLAAFEAEWDYSMDYAREILDVGVRPLKKFFDAQAIGDYREGISKSAVTRWRRWSHERHQDRSPNAGRGRGAVRGPSRVPARCGLPDVGRTR